MGSEFFIRLVAMWKVAPQLYHNLWQKLRIKIVLILICKAGLVTNLFPSFILKIPFSLVS